MPTERAVAVPRRSAVVWRARVAARTLCLGVLCGAFLGGAALAKDKEKEPREKPPKAVHFILEREGADLTSGTNVNLTVTLKNDTDKDFVVDVGRLTAQGQYELLASDGDEVLESGGWRPDKDDPEDKHPVPVRARHSVSRFVSLGEHLGELAHTPGRLRITLTLCDDALPGPDPEGPGAHCISSNAVIVVIPDERNVIGR